MVTKLWCQEGGAVVNGEGEGALVSKSPCLTGSGSNLTSWVDCSTLWWQVLTKFCFITLLLVLVSFFFGVTLNTPASCHTIFISQSDYQAFCPRRLLATGLTNQTPQRFDGKMPVYPLPGHGSSVSPPGQCSGSMPVVMEDTLMSHVSWGDSAFPPVSEASGYGNKVLFTPVPASQGWCRWPAPTRLQLQTTLETNPEDRAPLGWEIEFESVCCGYQASTGSDGIELKHDQLRIMLPLKSKQSERSSHVHPASVAQALQSVDCSLHLSPSIYLAMSLGDV